MRSSNQAAIKQECRQAIPEILDKFRLPNAGDIVLDTNGWVNPCFFIGDQYVVRFNARDPGLPKFQREKRIYDLLKTSDVPVPQNVWLDESKELSRFDVLISERLPGAPIEPAWPKMSKHQQIKLATTAGTLLSRLHARQFDYFGELTGTGPLPKTSTWISYLQAKLSFHLAEAEKLGIFRQDENARFLAALEKNADLLNLQKPSLIHVDFHFGNLLYIENQITAVLDFEWAFAGDPLYDLCRWIHPGSEEWAGSREPFLTGYGRVDFSEDEKHRARVYQMIQNVELTVVSKLHFEKEECESFRETSLRQLRSL